MPVKSPATESSDGISLLAFQNVGDVTVPLLLVRRHHIGFHRDESGRGARSPSRGYSMKQLIVFSISCLADDNDYRLSGGSGL